MAQPVHWKSSVLANDAKLMFKIPSQRDNLSREFK